MDVEVNVLREEAVLSIVRRVDASMVATRWLRCKQKYNGVCVYVMLSVGMTVQLPLDDVILTTLASS